MKRPLAIGIVIACCVVSVVGFGLFQYEVKALFWHARHGFTQKWNDLEIRVPLKYNVNTTSRSIQIFVLPGRLRARLKAPFAVISMFRAKDDAEGTEMANFDDRIASARQVQGFRLVNTRSLDIAGTPTQCREQLATNFRSYGLAYVVHCQAESKLLFASFEGSAALLVEFYSVANEIRIAKAK